MGDKMREEFELWFENNKHFLLGTRKVSKSDCYFIWESSRAALCIELYPCAVNNGSLASNVVLDYKHDCLAYIEAQGLGIKVK